MKKTLIILGGTLILLTLNSCFTQRITLVKGAKVDNLQPTFEESQPFFVGGISQTKEISASQVCRGKTPVAVDVMYSALDAVLGNFTRYIYSPRTIKVYCK